ncbi:MAG: hypothetical protein U5N56_08215 [Candidatus Marinimicrobia bacterium]|nr:hypothetical protein [Candidatus Neomarinimicrobiota bacterium]
MKKCKRISTIISGRWLSFFAVTVLALALIIPTAAKSATAVDLGAAGNYVILAESGNIHYCRNCHYGRSGT